MALKDFQFVDTGLYWTGTYTSNGQVESTTNKIIDLVITEITPQKSCCGNKFYLNKADSEKVYSAFRSFSLQFSPNNAFLRAIIFKLSNNGKPVIIRRLKFQAVSTAQVLSDPIGDSEGFNTLSALELNVGYTPSSSNPNIPGTANLPNPGQIINVNDRIVKVNPIPSAPLSDPEGYGGVCYVPLAFDLNFCDEVVSLNDTSGFTENNQGLETQWTGNFPQIPTTAYPLPPYFLGIPLIGGLSVNPNGTFWDGVEISDYEINDPEDSGHFDTSYAYNSGGAQVTIVNPTTSPVNTADVNLATTISSTAGAQDNNGVTAYATIYNGGSPVSNTNALPVADETLAALVSATQDEQTNTGLTAYATPFVGGAPVSSGNALPVNAIPSAMTAISGSATASGSTTIGTPPANSNLRKLILAIPANATQSTAGNNAITIALNGVTIFSESPYIPATSLTNSGDLYYREIDFSTIAANTGASGTLTASLANALTAGELQVNAYFD
jgi:hypothetical protein